MKTRRVLGIVVLFDLPRLREYWKGDDKASNRGLLISCLQKITAAQGREAAILWEEVEGNRRDVSFQQISFM